MISFESGVASLTNSDRFENAQSGYFALVLAAFRTKYLTAIPAMMFPFVKRKFNVARVTIVGAFVFEPMISRSAWNVADAPGKHATSRVPDVNCSVIPLINK